MSITTNDELKTSIAAWLNREDLTTMIPDFIRLAEARISTDFKSQHISTEATIVTDAVSKSLPSSNKGIISAYLDTDPKTPLDYMPPDELNSRWASSQTDKPAAYTIKGQTIYFAPSPDTSYDCILSYYAMPNIESDSTNSLLTNFPNLYLFASLVEGKDYLEEDSTKYNAKYLMALDGALEEEDYYGALSIHLSDA